MNLKEEQLRRPFEPRDYSFQSKNALENSDKKSYDYQRSSLGKRFQEDDGDMLADYELKRERDKTKILEERLKNKQIFIGQMKEFQKELTRAFDESQEELKYYKGKCEQLSGVELVHCLEEIARLKEALKQTQESKRKGEDEFGGRGRIYSKEKYASKSLQRSKTDQAFHTKQSEAKDISPLDFAKHFLRTFNAYSSDEILSNGSKLGKFVNHFLMMVETCNPQTTKSGLKQDLKFGWKWIKEVVKVTGKNASSLNHSDKQQLLENIRRLTNRKSIGEVFPFIEDTLDESKQQKKLCKLMVEFYQLPQSTSLKQLEQYMKKRRENSKH